MVWALAKGGAMATMLSLFPKEDAKGLWAEEFGRDLKGEYVLCEETGGLRTMLEFELARGRRFGLETEGIGA